MAACQFSRLDSLDTTNTPAKWPSRLIYVESEDRIFCAWVDPGVVAAGPTQIRFAKYDPVNHVASDEVEVYTTSPRNGNIGAIDMVRLSDGTLVVVWYNSTADDDVENAMFASESADDGATWSAAVPLPSTAAAETKNTFPIGMCDDGSDNIHVLAVGLSSPAGLGDVIAFARTGVDTWTEGAKIYDGTASDPTTPSWGVTQVEQAYHSMWMSSTLVGCIVGFRSKASANNIQRVTALVTDDGWATATAVDLDTAATNYAGIIQHVRLSDGRVYVVWSDPDTNQKPIFAYTDDDGTTWTLVGTPTEVSDQMTALGVTTLDPTYDNTLCLDARENLIWCFDTGSATTPSRHLTFRSTDPSVVAGWVLSGDCSHTASDLLSTSTCGRGVIVGADLHRLAGMNRSTHFTLEFIFVENAGVPEEPPPPPPMEESVESAADDNNIMFRIDLFDGRGFSIHAHGASAAVTWDEGDRETGTEVPIMVTGSPSIDPAITAVDILPGLWRVCVDNEDGFGRRVYVDAAEDQQEVRYDPLRAVWRSAKMHLKDFFILGAVRGFFLDYRKDGLDTLPVQLWIDDRPNRIIEFPATGGQFVQSRLYPLPTFQNLGTTIQLVIDETSVDPWWVNGVGIKYIPKGHRG